MLNDPGVHRKLWKYCIKHKRLKDGTGKNDAYQNDLRWLSWWTSPGQLGFYGYYHIFAIRP